MVVFRFEDDCVCELGKFRSELIEYVLICCGVVCCDYVDRLFVVDCFVDSYVGGVWVIGDHVDYIQFVMVQVFCECFGEFGVVFVRVYDDEYEGFVVGFLLDRVGQLVCCIEFGGVLFVLSGCAEQGT